jgi:hypothetical protein
MSRADYAHWNEDADHMWWQEEGRHVEEPEYDPDDYLDRGDDDGPDTCRKCGEETTAEDDPTYPYCLGCAEADALNQHEGVRQVQGHGINE